MFSETYSCCDKLDDVWCDVSVSERFKLPVLVVCAESEPLCAEFGTVCSENGTVVFSSDIASSSSAVTSMYSSVSAEL